MDGLIAQGLSTFLNIPIGTNSDSDENTDILDLDQIHKHGLVWIDHTMNAATPAAISSSKTNQDSQKTMTIFAKTLTGKTHELSVSEFEFIESIDTKINKVQGSSFGIKMISEGRQLEHGHTLCDYKIKDGHTVHIIMYDLKVGPSKKCTLPESLLDHRFDFTYPKTGSSGEKYTRGKREFERPYGWVKHALRVLDRYEDTVWLGAQRGASSGTESVAGEWPVSYHGTNRDYAKSITENGYELSKGKRFKFGRGIYSTPTPDIAAKLYAPTFEYEGSKYELMFMNRVDMEATRVVQEPGVGIYFVTSEEKSIRPYAILIKKIG